MTFFSELSNRLMWATLGEIETQRVFLALKQCPNTAQESFRSPLSDTFTASSAGSTYISETWSTEPACPCCFLTARSNGFTCANKGTRQIPATLYFHPMCDFITGWCCFLRFFMCWMSWDSLPAIHFRFHYSPSPSPLLDLSVSLFP